MDYALLRKKMIGEQLIPRGITNPKVLDAFYKVERHKFVPGDLIASAYADFPLAIGEGQTISQPYIVALMTEYLDLTGKERVLEIGTGSGYQTAILAQLSQRVYSVERIVNLAQKAKDLLSSLGYSNIEIMRGDGTLGWPEAAPFDRIIITAATAHIPEPLIEQLREGGRFILPLGGSFGQALTLAEKENNKLNLRKICDCVFVPLVGKYSSQD
jgi:protein-L-isoaspartate(D-aspartate) O-methyltransferase